METGIVRFPLHPAARQALKNIRYDDGIAMQHLAGACVCVVYDHIAELHDELIEVARRIRDSQEPAPNYHKEELRPVKVEPPAQPLRRVRRLRPRRRR